MNNDEIIIHYFDTTCSFHWAITMANNKFAINMVKKCLSSLRSFAKISIRCLLNNSCMLEFDFWPVTILMHMLNPNNTFDTTISGNC